MTKHDIRIRRGSFSKGQIERYKDFRTLSGRYEQQRSGGSAIKLVALLITFLVLVSMVLFGFWKLKDKVEKKEIKPQESAVFQHDEDWGFRGNCNRGDHPPGRDAILFI